MPANVFVDNSTGDNGDTGGDTDPWQTFQYALDNIDTAAGFGNGINWINVSDQATETLTANQDWTNHGTRNNDTRIGVRGWGRGGDGYGRFSVGAYDLVPLNTQYINMSFLKISGATVCTLEGGNYNHYNDIFLEGDYDNVLGLMRLGNGTGIRLSIKNTNTGTNPYCIRMNGGGRLSESYLESKKCLYATSGSNARVRKTCFNVTAANGCGIYYNNSYPRIDACSFYSTSKTGTLAIDTLSSHSANITNNLIQGFDTDWDDGTNANSVKCLTLIDNSVSDCTNKDIVGYTEGQVEAYGNEDLLAVDLFAKVGTIDYLDWETIIDFFRPEVVGNVVANSPLGHSRGAVAHAAGGGGGTDSMLRRSNLRGGY